MRRYTRSAVQLLFAAVLFVGLALVYEFTSVVAWVGGYPVHVSVERTGLRPVNSAAVALLTRYEYEWFASDENPARIDSVWKPVDVSDGSTFVVEVKHYGKDSGFGRQISYARQQVLVLRVAYADGVSHLLVADLPEYDTDRAMRLRVP